MAPLSLSCWRGPGRIVFFGEPASEYQAIGHLRTEALIKGELHLMDPAEGAV